MVVFLFLHSCSCSCLCSYSCPCSRSRRSVGSCFLFRDGVGRESSSVALRLYLLCVLMDEHEGVHLAQLLLCGRVVALGAGTTGFGFSVVFLCVEPLMSMVSVCFILRRESKV